MTTTPNYGLRKPSYEEHGDVADLNYNMDIVDGALAEKMPNPTNTGTQDQILRSDGQGGSHWDNAASQEEVGAAVTEWLEDNVPTGTTVVVDRSLSIDGAAADAKKTGDALSDLKSAFTATMNLKTPIHFVPGAVSSQDGSDVVNDKSARCEYIKVRNGTTILFTPTTELSASGYIAIIRKYNTSKTIIGSEPNLGVSDTSKVFTANFAGYIRIVVYGVGYPVITDGMLNALNQSIIVYTDLSEYVKQEKEQETLAGVLSNNLSDVSCEVGAIKSADGSDTSGSASVRTNFINVSAGTEITFKPNIDDFPTGYYLDIRKYDTRKEFVPGSGVRLGIVRDDDYTYVADADGYLRFMMTGVNGATITTELLQSLGKCVVYIIDTRDYPSVRDKVNTNYSFISNNKLNYSDQMYRHNLYKIKALNGTTKSGFYDVGGVWRASNNFQTLVVENNDDAIFGFLYSGIVYNNTVAGVVWMNEKQVPQAYDLTTDAFIKHEAKYIVRKDYPYVAFCTYTGYDTVLGAIGIVPGSPFEQLSLVITGDSVETLAGGKWCDLLADKLGVLSYTNCAVGGTCMSPAYNSSTAISGDTRISAMPETADIVLIGGGTNDWGNNIVLGDLSTLADTDTFAGAVDSMIRKMHTKYPDAIIVFTSNQFTISPNRHNFDDQTGILNNQGKSAGDYANMMKTVCEYRGIPYIPVYQQCGINHHNYTHWLLEETNASGDTVFMHPSSAGAKLMLRVIENAFQNYIQPVPEFAK